MNDDVHTSMTDIPYDPEARALGVLVGYDGSEHSVRALHYAARAAVRNHCRLTVVTAYTVPAMIYTTMVGIPQVPEDVARRNAAQKVLEEARDRLTGFPGEVELRAEEGDAAGALVRLSREARLAVVGARGRGGFLGRLLGSVSSALPSHAHCPTVVVPRQYEIGKGEGAERFALVADDAPVVAGTDRSEQSNLATRFAAQAAMDRLAPLHLSMALPPMESLGAWYPEMVVDASVADQRHEQLEEKLAEDAARLREQFPVLQVTSEVLVGDPIAQLVEHSRTAQLVVVGTRGHGRMASALLGSVSRGLLQRAEGPVLVIPDLSTEGSRRGAYRPR